MNYELRIKAETSINNSQFAIRNSQLSSHSQFAIRNSQLSSHSQFAIRNSQFSNGFTIIELLVASLLLGMLVTVLTMIFNQSSIAWRTGVASVVDMGDIREDIANVRDEADNIILAPETSGKMFLLVSPWDAKGDLRKRAVNSTEMGGADANEFRTSATLLYNNCASLRSDSVKAKDLGTVNCGSRDRAKSAYGYTVGVTSAGPNRKFGDYDDITTWPEEF